MKIWWTYYTIPRREVLPPRVRWTPSLAALVLTFVALRLFVAVVP